MDPIFWHVLSLFYNKSYTFNPAKDIPSLKGKVILVTGGANGLGKQSVLDFARHEPAQIWIADLKAEEGAQAIADIKDQVPGANIRFLQLDLSSIDAVKTAAKQVKAECGRLDIFMLNAGILLRSSGASKDGYELHFAINFIGHALFTQLLTPLLLETAKKPGGDPRVVFVASTGHDMAPKEGIRYETVRTAGDALTCWEKYGQSKLAVIAWAREFARANPGIKTASIHPGRVITNLGKGVAAGSMWMSWLLPLGWLVTDPLDSAAKNQLWAAISDDVVSGEYYMPVGITGQGTPLSQDESLSKTLWEWTEKELAGHLI